MYIAGQKDMQEIDKYTIEEIGLPGVVLMENAGAMVVEEILSHAPCRNPRVIILAGGGNNGGDGFVIARRLCDRGLDPLLCLLVDPNRVKGDAKVHLDVYINSGLPILYFERDMFKEIQEKLDKADIIVDAILGTGVNGPVREPISKIISMVNTYSEEKLIISVDIPSGVNSDNGKVDGVAIKATKTITFVFPKKGFFLNDGPMYVGEWKAVNISIKTTIADDLHLDMPTLITKELCHSMIPVRPQHGHKGTFGHVLVLGGSRQYVGAPIFTAKAALNSGAGLVTLAVPNAIYPMAAAQIPEALLLPLPDMDGHFAKEVNDKITPSLLEFDSIAIGPGLSRFTEGEEWLYSLLNSLTNQTVILDADALYFLGNHLGWLKHYSGNVILTPHPGEMARLLNTSVREVEENRLDIAINFARENSVYLLLKGHRSIIASPTGEVYINPHGHDALGKGGSGDILTGIIASFVAQGAQPLHAVISASYLHARAGEEQARTLSHYGVMPFDIIDGVKSLLTKQ